jgi:CBS domain containing-hemolysin-like protein
MTALLAAIALSILASALYSGIETGAYRMNRMRLRHEVESGSLTARALGAVVGNMERFVCMTLVGNNIAIYAATGYFTSLVAMLHLGRGATAELIGTLVLAPILLVFADLLPKSLFTVTPNRLMRWCAPWILLSHAVFFPVAAALFYIVCFWRRVVGGRAESRGIVVSARYLDYLLTEGREQGVITPQQDLVMRNIMQLRQRPVRASMIPLENMDMIPVEAAGAAALDAIRAHNHARLPVYEGRRERVVGLLHTLDYLAQSSEGRVRDYMIEIGDVRDDAPLDEAFRQMQSAGQTMVAVRDAGGRARGFVTMGGLLQDIFIFLE